MRRRIPVFIVVVSISFATDLAAQEPASSQEPTPTSQISAAPAKPAMDLFLARSIGGSRYTAGDAVFVPDASSPELVRLPKGGLLALFDRQTSDNGTTLFATRSSDDGRKWTRARPIRLTGSDRKSNKAPNARHADVLRLPNGTLRMYFTEDGPDGSCLVRSATSIDGLRYKVDDVIAAALEKCSDARPGVVRIGRQIHLFVSRMQENRAPKPNVKMSTVVSHFTSHDGRKFELMGLVNLAGGMPGAGFAAYAKGMRAVVTLDDKLRSVISRDGKKWTLEPNVLLAMGRNASVVEMRDGTFLMAFEDTGKPSMGNNSHPALVTLAPRIKSQSTKSEAEASEPQLIDGAADAATADTVDTSEAVSETGWDVFAEDSASPNGTLAPDSTQALDAVESGEEVASASESTDALVNTESAEAHEEPIPDEQAKAEAERLAKERDEWLAVPDPMRTPHDVLPPLPDFTTPVNYAEWYAQLCDINTPDNAYWAYGEFMPSPLDPNRQQEWPALEIMYNRSDFTEPAPWDPAKLPEWETSYQASKALLEKFEAASHHAGFARPVQFRPDDAAESPTGQPLLVGLLLPDLSAHRSLVKQTLGANWRIDEGGKPNADKMMEGWRTALSSANHMHQGATLIEQLVGTSEQNLVQSDARYALKEGVFKGKQLEEALALLEHNDHDDFDTARSMQGEHAFVLDLMQAMFKSDKPGDPPRPAPEAIDKVVPLFGEDSKVIPEIKKMTPADVKKTLNAFETYYNEASNALGTGYPQVRASDLDQMAKQHVDVSPLTHALLPAFGRIQKTRARNEASRRATQLSYAVHIYKEQNGHWPQSLNELPDRFSTTMRTDPFTGGQFGYRVDENGPVIYSLSENGIDDSGKHATRWDDEKNGDSDDHVFWPVQPK